MSKVCDQPGCDWLIAGGQVDWREDGSYCGFHRAQQLSMERDEAPLPDEVDLGNADEVYSFEVQGEDGGWFSGSLDAEGALVEIALEPGAPQWPHIHAIVDPDLTFGLVCRHEPNPLASLVNQEALRGTEMADDWDASSVPEAAVLSLSRRILDLHSPPPDPAGARTSPFPLILPGEDWDGLLVAPERVGFWPVGDAARPFRTHGAAYFESLGEGDRAEFFLDVPSWWEDDGPSEPHGPWYFRAHATSQGESTYLASFLGGFMGADDTNGTVIWTGPSIVGTYYDHSMDHGGVFQVARFWDGPPNLRDPSWWLALARAVIYGSGEALRNA